MVRLYSNSADLNVTAWERGSDAVLGLYTVGLATHIRGVSGRLPDDLSRMWALSHTFYRCSSSACHGNRLQIGIVGSGSPLLQSAGEMGLSFAAVKNDGSVVTWGVAHCGGNSDEVRDKLTGGVRQVVGIVCAFAPVKEDGSVITWEQSDFGGNSDSVKYQLSGGVDRVVGTGHAFAAVKDDGSVVTWGHADWSDSDSVKDQLTGGVDNVVGNGGAYAAVKEDGSVVTWGCADCGGDSESVKSELSGVPQMKANLPA